VRSRSDWSLCAQVGWFAPASLLCILGQGDDCRACTAGSPRVRARRRCALLKPGVCTRALAARRRAGMVLASPGHQRIYCRFAGLTRGKASYGVDHAAAALTSDGAAERLLRRCVWPGEVRCLNGSIAARPTLTIVSGARRRIRCPGRAARLIDGGAEAIDSTDEHRWLVLLSGACTAPSHLLHRSIAAWLADGGGAAVGGGLCCRCLA
jgi:hypothetical protein